MASAKKSPTQPVKKLVQSNVVKGRVEIKGTRTGVPGLIVRVYDVKRSGNSAGARAPLGSSPPNQGSFEIKYDDELLLKQRPDGSRPDLLVSVVAPEGGNNGNENLPIFETEVRRSAAREECFLIHVELGELKKRSVLVPYVLDGVVGDPKAAGAAAVLRAGSRASRSLRSERATWRPPLT